MKYLVHRPVRASQPLGPPTAVQVASPPQSPDGATGGVPIQALLPILGSVSSLVMITVARGSNPIFMVVGALIFVVALVSGLAMSFTQRSRAARTRRISRERYLDYLEDLRDSQREAARAVRAQAVTTNPDPVLLPQIVADQARVWERRPQDDDFLQPRFGVGVINRFDLEVPAEQNPIQPLDPLMLAEARQVAAAYSLVDLLEVGFIVSRYNNGLCPGTERRHRLFL